LANGLTLEKKSLFFLVIVITSSKGVRIPGHLASRM
jgi:hypothetical protein